MIRIALAALLMVGTAQAQEKPRDTLAKIRETGSVGLGIRDRSLPFGYFIDGKPVGYGIDMCLAVVAELERVLAMPLKVDMRVALAAARFTSLADGSTDMDCGTSSNTVERQRQVAFSNTYFLTAAAFVSRKSGPVVSIDDLKGRFVAITGGTTNFDQLRTLDATRGLGLNLIVTKDTAEGFARFNAGDADAFVADDILIAALVAAAPEPAAYQISRERIAPPEPYAIMMRRDDPAFKAVVDRATAALLRSPDGLKLYARWFEAPLPGRNVTLGLPMSLALRRAFATPTDSADPITYQP